MEFTYSRAALMMCGAILISAFAVPFCGIMDGNLGGDIQELAEKDARIIDTFWCSDVDEVRLEGASMLPSGEYGLEVDGRLLTITCPDGKRCSAALRHDSGTFVLSHGGTVVLARY